MIEHRTVEDIERLELADRLCRHYANYDDTGMVVTHVVMEEFPGKVALVSSFGAESAILLHLISRVDPGLPVIFLDTLKHDRIRMIGNAVCPPVMKAVIEALLDTSASKAPPRLRTPEFAGV